MSGLTGRLVELDLRRGQKLADPLQDFITGVKDGIREKYASTSYSDCYVAFLDILGMKELVREDYGTLREIFNAIESAEDLYKRTTIMETQQPFLSPDHVRLTSVSDALVLSIKASEKHAISMLLGFTSNLLHELLNLSPRPVFARGGVVRGDIYQDSKFVFGPALVDAYLVESKIAGAMRCVVSDSLFHDEGFVRYQGQGMDHLHLDPEDGRYFVKLADPSNREKLLAVASEVLASTASESIQQKYRWLQRYAQGVPAA